MGWMNVSVKNVAIASKNLPIKNGNLAMPVGSCDSAVYVIVIL